MKSVITMLALLLVSSFAQAQMGGGMNLIGIGTNDMGIGLRKGKAPYAALEVYAKSLGSKTVVVEDSTDILDVTTKTSFGEATSLNVRFEIRDKSVKESDDGGLLFCEGSIDLKNDKWIFDGGCEI